MKTKTLLSILALGLFLSAFSQNTIELTFTAIDSADHEQFDSIKVMNKTQGGDTVLLYPDTVLVLDYQVGISKINTGSERFQVFQNYPNPVRDKTTISFFVPERDKVSLIVTDILGRELINTERILDQGYHSYRFTPGNGSLFLFTVQYRESSSSTKILNTNTVSNNTSTLAYIGSEDSSPQFKAVEDIQDFLFSLGDELLYIGYTDTLQSGKLDIPEESKEYAFQFANNIPCPGTPTVEYEGQIYTTIQILNQCWLKDNLNIGIMINGVDDMADNNTIEKYCFDDDPANCITFGGLYQWNEMMQYVTTPGTQGICPSGWHIPTDEEWKILEGTVDSEYGIGDPVWDLLTQFRGFNAGLNLKSTNSWYSFGNGTDLFGYSGLLGGSRGGAGDFYGIDINGDFWTSTDYYHGLNYEHSSVLRDTGAGEWGRSVRCVKD